MSNNTSKIINRKNLIIFVIIVALLSISLTIIFSNKKTNNIKQDEPTNNDTPKNDYKSTIIYMNNQNDEYSLEDDKIIIKNFHISKIASNSYLVFTAKKTTDEKINTLIEYKILLYDKDGNILKEENGGILSGIKTEEHDCSMKLKFDQNILDHIEFRRLQNKEEMLSALKDIKS